MCLYLIYSISGIITVNIPLKKIALKSRFNKQAEGEWID